LYRSSNFDDTEDQASGGWQLAAGFTLELQKLNLDSQRILNLMKAGS
jgi:hypothetical protein